MFTKAEIWTVGKTENGMAALLRLPASSRCVPIYVSADEAQSILAALSGMPENPLRIPRVIMSFAKAVSAKPESVEVLKAAAPRQYRTLLHFVRGSNRFSLETRVPDALAIALRSSVPIYLEDAILKEDAIGVSMAESEAPFATQLNRLEEELGRRVSAEDYEQAARIRDRILQIKERMRTERE